VEEACVKKCLELKGLPFPILHQKLSGLPSQHYRQPEDEESDDELEASFSTAEFNEKLVAFREDLLARFCNQEPKWYHDNGKYKDAFLGVLREVEKARPQICDPKSELSKRLAALNMLQEGYKRTLKGLISENSKVYNDQIVTLIRPSGTERWVVRLDSPGWGGKELTVKPVNLTKSSNVAAEGAARRRATQKWAQAQLRVALVARRVALVTRRVNRLSQRRVNELSQRSFAWAPRSKSTRSFGRPS
jgi:hypothetical protein